MLSLAKRMENNAERLRAARKELDDATAEMHRLITDAHNAGMTVTTIARTLGVSRQTCYTNLSQTPIS